MAPSKCTHCGACYGSEASHYGSFTCIKEFKNQGLGFYHGGQEHVCKHFYAGWDCHATPGYCDDANSAGMYVGNYEGEDTCCASTDTSYGKGCADLRADTEYDYDAKWGCCGAGGAPVVADAETTIYLGDPGAGGLNSCDVKVTLAWPGSGAAMPSPTAKPVAAAPTAKPTPQPGAPAPSGPPSAGSCYPTPTTVTCDVAEADCDGNHYAPGFIGGSGCCHCDSVECDHSEETSEEACSYYAMPEAGDGGGGGATCADNQKKGKCNKAPGCEWKGGECGDKATDACAGLKKGACKEANCDYDKKKKRCEAKTYERSCKDSKSKKDCKNNWLGCEWHKDKDKCKDKEEQDTCSLFTSSYMCDAHESLGCEWKNDECKSTGGDTGDESTGGDTGDACSELSKKKCKKTDGCEYKKKNKKCKSTK